MRRQVHLRQVQRRYEVLLPVRFNDGKDVDGFVKVVADAKHGEVLGVHIIGPYATEIIAEAVTAIELEATIEEMMFTIHAHPTVAEALLDGFSSVEGMAVNV